MGKSANNPPSRSRSKPSAALRDDDRPLSARDVAKLCGVELKTIHNWVAQGLLPHFRTPGRHLRFQASDVRSFLTDCSDGASKVSTAPRALLVAPSTVRTALKRYLRGHAIDVTDDPHAALIRAGRTVPTLVVLDPRGFRRLDPARYVQALMRELPSVTIAWLSDKPPRGAAGVVAVSRRDLGRLGELIAG